MMISKFESIAKSSLVIGELTFNKFISLIQNPKEYKESIILSRIFYQYGDTELYNLIKRTDIPAVTINCTFKKRRRNNNINNFSGLIYLDVDNSVNLNLKHPLIYSSWISLSGHGRGLVVKVRGLTTENFKETYKALGNLLQVAVDFNAAKPTQLNVLSYDPNIYFNPNSETYIAPSTKKVVNDYQKKNNNTIGTVNDFLSSQKLRFSNLKEYVETLRFNGEAVMLLDEKVELSIVQVPNLIEEGRRNKTLSGICYQTRALNINISFNSLFKILDWVNKTRCTPRYPKQDLIKLVKHVMSLPIQELVPVKNYSRRIFFNPDYILSNTEKRALSMQCVNWERTAKILDKLEAVIYNWDFMNKGKITQKKIAETGEVRIGSIKKYYPLYKSEIIYLNGKYIETLKNRPP